MKKKDKFVKYFDFGMKGFEWKYGTITKENVTGRSYDRDCNGNSSLFVLQRFIGKT